MEKEQLLKDWLKFKKNERKAKKSRVEIEEQIKSLYKDFKESSKTFTEENFKVNIEKNIVYKLDQEKYVSIRNDIDPNLRPEKITFALDVKGFDWLKENNQGIYNMVSDCVEIKENKSTIKVEKI